MSWPHVDRLWRNRISTTGSLSNSSEQSWKELLWKSSTHSHSSHVTICWQMQTHSLRKLRSTWGESIPLHLPGCSSHWTEGEQFLVPPKTFHLEPASPQHEGRSMHWDRSAFPGLLQGFSPRLSVGKWMVPSSVTSGCMLLQASV